MECEYAGNMALATAYFTPKTSRPQYDPYADNEPHDCVCVLSVGEPFRYVIPSFDVIAIEMRQLKVKGYTAEGEERNYDLFIRNDPSLCRPYHVWMVIKDGTVIEVRTIMPRRLVV